jgi:hypothetical protein
MQRSDMSFAPPRKTLRQFAGLWLLFFGGLAVWQAAVRGNVPLAAGLACAAVVAGGLGLVRPDWVRWLYVGWMVAAFPVGWAVSQLIILCLYFAVFTPVAVIFKLTGRDVLCRRPDPAAASYWVPKPAVADPRGYFRQF